MRNHGLTSLSHNQQHKICINNNNTAFIGTF